MNLTGKILKLTAVVCFFLIAPAKAQDAVAHESAAKNDFNVKDFVFSHVSNDYEFHITDIGEHKISVPLPVILKSRERGWFVFMSSKFHHKSVAYKGFAIETEGEYRNKIVEILPDGTKVKPLDLSISKNVFTLLFTVCLLSFIMIYVQRCYRRNPLKAPRGLQAMLEPLILFVNEDIAKPSIGKGYEKYSSYLLTIFFFVLTLNLMGLIPVFPFGANVTGNISCTAALALCTFAVTMRSSNKHYWIEKLWTPGMPVWLKVPLPLMPLVEILSIFTGPIALCIRLFANMLSGHMVVTVLMSMIFVFSSLGVAVNSGVSLISILFSIFMMMLDVLVSFIQAYVFTLLSALYFGSARHA